MACKRSPWILAARFSFENIQKNTRVHAATFEVSWYSAIHLFFFSFHFFFLFFTWIASALRVASCPKRNFNHFLNILFNKYLGKACKCIESSLDSSSSFFYRTNYLYSELIHSIRLSRDVGSIVGGSANSLCLVEKWKNTLHKRRRIWFTRTQISFFFFFYFPTVTLNRRSRVSKCYFKGMVCANISANQSIVAALDADLFSQFSFHSTFLNVKSNFKQSR